MTAELFAALAVAQGEFSPVVKSKEVEVLTKAGKSYRFSYAPLEEIISSCRPALAKNGLGFYHRTLAAEGGSMVECVVYHSSGGTITCGMFIPDQASIQEYGSALTYARRYTLQCVLGVNAEDDDDGNSSVGNQAQVAAPKKPAKKPEPPAEPKKDQVFEAASTAMGKAIGKADAPEVLRVFHKAQLMLANKEVAAKFLDDLKAQFDGAVLMRVRSAGTAEESIALTEMAREVMEAKLLSKERYQIITQASMDRAKQLANVGSETVGA